MLRVRFEPTTRGFSARGLCQSWATTAYDSTSRPNTAGRIRTCNLRNLSPVPLAVGLLRRVRLTSPGQRKLKDSNLQGLKGPPEFEAGTPHQMGSELPIDFHHAEAAGFEPARPALAAFPISSRAPRANGASTSEAIIIQHDGGSRTRVCGFAGRHLATRPRRGSLMSDE